MAKKSDGNPDIHVTGRPDGWAVIKEGAERASSTHPTQKEAISEAQKLARKSETELHIHGKDGKVRDRRSYGSDPYPPKG